MKRVTFIGTGYVGLVGGAGVSDFGNQVICADILSPKIEMLQKGEIPIYEPGLDEVVARNVKAGRLTFTTDIARAVQDSEIIFIAVGTPEGENGMADLTAIRSVAKMIGENLNQYKVICTKSTVPVGTGDLIQQIVKENQKIDCEFDYISNPEFLREGAAVTDFLRPDRVVIGATSERAFKIMEEVYRPLYINETPILHTTVTTAEMIKYASNAFLALKISYINEIANLCEKVNADVHAVAKAMGQDGRISPKFLHPGPGFGGSCFPKDTLALVKIGEEKGVDINTVKAAIKTNENQKKRMVDKLRVLVGGSFKNKTIGILGLSFKPATDDVRESSAGIMLKSLQSEGAHIRAYDPIAAENMAKDFPDIHYCSSWEQAAEMADGIAIMTEWNEFRGLDLNKLKMIMKKPVILDSRNILSIADLTKHGFDFDNVGRIQ